MSGNKSSPESEGGRESRDSIDKSDGKVGCKKVDCEQVGCEKVGCEKVGCENRVVEVAVSIGSEEAGRDFESTESPATKKRRSTWVRLE